MCYFPWLLVRREREHQTIFAQISKKRPMYKKIIRIKICFENEVFFQALRTVSIPENCTVEFLEANDQGTCDVYFL